MQPIPPYRKVPIRRILIVSLTLFLFAVIATLCYDTTPPDDSDFLPQARSTAVPDAENGFHVLGGLNVPFEQIDREIYQSLLEHALPGSTGWDPGVAESILDDNAQALQTLATALAKQSWHYHHTDQGREVPEYSRIQALANLKRIAAIQAAENRDLDSCLAHIGDMFRIADRVSTSNLGLVGYLVGITIESIAQSTILRATAPLGSPHQLTALQNLASGHRLGPHHWHHALRSELTLALHTIEQNGRRLPESYGGQQYLSIVYKPNLTAHLILQLYREAAGYTAAPNLAARSTTVADSYDGFADHWFDYLNPNFTGNYAAAETAATLPYIHARLARLNIDRTRSLLLIALQLYQLDHQNQLPPSLTDLVPTYLPELPPDPYNGAPLHYDPTRRLIWSVGENLTDNGGHHDHAAPHRIDWDNPTFSISLPTAR